MNLPKNKSIIVVVLSFLLVLCLGGLAYWYFFLNKGVPLPEEYEFLEKFEITEDGKSDGRRFEVNGLMYDFQDYGESISFDLNVWDLKEGKSLYYQDISISSVDVSLSDEIVSPVIIPVSIVVDLKEGSCLWSLEKIVIGEERNLELLQKLYSSINSSSSLYDEEFSLLPIIYKTEDLQSRSVGYGVDALYPLWLESVLQSSPKANDIRGGSEALDTGEYLKEVEDFKKAKLKGGDEEKWKEAYAQGASYPYACILTHAILQSTNVSQSDRGILFSQYCNFGVLKENLESTNMAVFQYRKEDLLGSLNSNRVTVDPRTEGEFSELTLSMSTELALAASLSGNGKYLNEEVLNKADTLFANRLIYPDRLSIGNVCKANFAYGFVNTDFSAEYRGAVKAFLSSDMEKALLLFDEDVYASLWCIYPYIEEEDFREFYYSMLVKNLYLNFVEEEEKNFLFGRDGEYRVGENVLFFNMLLGEYE